MRIYVQRMWWFMAIGEQSRCTMQPGFHNVSLMYTLNAVSTNYKIMSMFGLSASRTF